MPDVFTDAANDYDLTITTAADWTVSSGGMPNGDNYVTGDGSIALTYNLNGDDFDIFDGTAWSIEFWFYYTTGSAGVQYIATVVHTSATTNSQLCWQLIFNASEQINLSGGNTANGTFMSVTSTVLTASTWYHVVIVKQTTANMTLYLNNVSNATTSSSTGTHVTPDANYRLFFGTAQDGSGDINSPTTGVRVSKLAIYNNILDTTEINDHYVAMVAA